MVGGALVEGLVSGEMKQALKVVGSLAGVLILIGVAVILALALSRQATLPEPTATLVKVHDKPSPTATATSGPAFDSPVQTPTPTARPTSTRPPEPPTRAPTPTYTPGPPTLTPELLSTLIPGLQVFVFATTGEKYPEIYRIEMNPASSTVESTHLVSTVDLWRSRTYVSQLYPSPDGKRVAVSWAYGDGGATFVSILEVNDGRVTPLLGKGAEERQRALFLDWSPDGNNVLVLGFSTNSDLGDSVWLVDVRTHEYYPLDIKEVSDPQRVLSASFSPDGKAIVYAQTDGYRCGSKMWRLALDGPGRRLLYEDPELRVEDVLWSPDGSHIAFTQWQETDDLDDFALGELWVMKADGSERRLLGPVEIGYYKRFVPVWSPNGQRIAFVKGSGSGKELEKLSSNGYIVDVQHGEIRQLTDFQNAQVLRPAWSPDGATVMFAVRQDISTMRFEPWIVAVDARDLCRLDEKAELVLGGRKSNPIIVWLPAFAGGR